MEKKYRRTPRGYNGTKPTGHVLSDVLLIAKANVEIKSDGRPDQILEAWPKIIGERFAPMTQAKRFHNAILYVSVSNSTLHSLLSQNDKPKILTLLKEKFPRVEIRDVVFRIG